MNKENETLWTNRAEELNKIWTNREDISEYRQTMLRLIEAELASERCEGVLDCGCGSGLVYRYLGDQFKQSYQGVDFTQDMIDYCSNAFPEASERFNQHDLTKPLMRNADLLITQNVLQHILLWQVALENIMYHARECVIICERTHKGQTLIAGYDPAVRWRFNVQDMKKAIKFFADKYGYIGEVEILAHPLTTFDEADCLTIYRVYRNLPRKAALNLGDEEYKPLRIGDKRPPLPNMIFDAIKRRL